MVFRYVGRNPSPIGYDTLSHCTAVQSYTVVHWAILTYYTLVQSYTAVQ